MNQHIIALLDLDEIRQTVAAIKAGTVRCTYCSRTGDVRYVRYEGRLLCASCASVWDMEDAK